MGTVTPGVACWPWPLWASSCKVRPWPGTCACRGSKTCCASCAAQAGERQQALLCCPPCQSCAAAQGTKLVRQGRWLRRRPHVRLERAVGHAQGAGQLRPAVHAADCRHAPLWPALLPAEQPAWHQRAQRPAACRPRLPGPGQELCQAGQLSRRAVDDRRVCPQHWARLCGARPGPGRPQADVHPGCVPLLGPQPLCTVQACMAKNGVRDPGQPLQGRYSPPGLCRAARQTSGAQARILHAQHSSWGMSSASSRVWCSESGIGAAAGPSPPAGRPPLLADAMGSCRARPSRRTPGHHACSALPMELQQVHPPAVLPTDRMRAAWLQRHQCLGAATQAAC